jgi:hypothetical protein
MESGAEREYPTESEEYQCNSGIFSLKSHHAVFPTPAGLVLHHASADRQRAA